MKVALILLGLVITLLLFAWLGLKVKPAAFPPVSQPQPELSTLPLPAGLPAPVERYYRQRYGEKIPLISTAVITGRGWMRPFGFALPIRFRFTHKAGQDYRHYIEATFFGLPVLKVNEYYVGGKEVMAMPWGVAENNPKLDQGGNLGMWAESIEWLPAIFLTDPQVHWEPVDDLTAFLVVLFGKEQERFLVRFDPNTDKIKYWEVMRYQNGAGDKILWINGTWFVANQGSPWVSFDAEEVVYNVDVDVSLAAKGP
jgi:hypothetical protein